MCRPGRKWMPWGARHPFMAWSAHRWLLVCVPLCDKEGALSDHFFSFFALMQAGLSTGTPQLLCPLHFDQFYHAERLGPEGLDLSPPPLAKPDLFSHNSQVRPHALRIFLMCSFQLGALARPALSRCFAKKLCVAAAEVLSFFSRATRRGYMLAVCLPQHSITAVSMFESS